ncbi:glutamine--tRNA ligase/YqeY domain fusion protein [Dethiosulfatarculus sandiegensis]|uniref:Glutamine--tRNA ligase n=1 Tax=Dethiosulfatarculus sandiegensis TaxID=1429043 RepID=A0A0D2J8J9_9BACT|nr:glutamine--tRNA ligase/YqeY domain fusion protein [Dethiosulfatarculus sandiegensis]KIX12006.1 glutaminyl-tRNA synthetase [Dethiosulfatarculus sandiegensis]
MATDGNKPSPNFIRHIVAEDTKTGKWGGRVVTRFPPEPNGYLHIGHAKSICLNFGIAKEYEGGKCHLRFDDTNPTKEDEEYKEAIIEDVKWLGFDWGENLFHASDYFERLYEFAVQLIKSGKAYVCDLSPEEVRQYRGTLTEPGKNSPYRERSVEENLDLFERMRAGEFPDGSRLLRAKIDMASPKLILRDPALYRIRKVRHERTGDKWCIYPMYDFAHCLSDSLERITHSICTLEFEDNRALYDWVLDALEVYHSQQIEFARLNLDFTIMSKRKLLQLVEQKYVSGWDDPRMPTISGLRRRGFTPESIRNFCERIGVGKKDSWIGIDKLENAIREDLNTKTPRVMGILRPLKLVIDNYPDDLVEELEAPYFPDDPPKMGFRKVPFSKELYVEQTDFMEEPFKKFWRLAPGREVRLRWAYFVTCTHVVKDEETGEILEVHCTYDPETKGGDAPDGRKVKGTIHWVSAAHSVPVEVRLYDRLFEVARPGEGGKDFVEDLNANSLETLPESRVERSLGQAKPGERYQFERTGYFCVDTKDSAEDHLVFNRIVTLRDTWAKILKQQAAAQGGKNKKAAKKKK